MIPQGNERSIMYKGISIEEDFTPQKSLMNLKLEGRTDMKDTITIRLERMLVRSLALFGRRL